MTLDKNFLDYLNLILNLIIEYSPKLIIAILILLIGLWLISITTKAFKRVMIKRNVEITLANFLGNLVFWALRILLLITVIAKLGIETSSFVAILGAAGLAIGLALQGSLSNFAGGILIILFKPFKIEDVIEVQGEIGTVKEIKIFNTKNIKIFIRVLIVGLMNCRRRCSSLSLSTTTRGRACVATATICCPTPASCTGALGTASPSPRLIWTRRRPLPRCGQEYYSDSLGF